MPVNDHSCTVPPPKDRQYPEKILQALIRYDITNPPGTEKAGIAYIADLLKKYGIDSQIIAKDPACPNLIARLKGRNNAPPLMIYGHVDVVTTEKQTWKHPPFEGKITGGYVWCRGALDMKGMKIPFDTRIIHYEPYPATPDFGMFDLLAGVLRKADPYGIPVPMLLPGATGGRFFSRLSIQTDGFSPMRRPPDFDFFATIHAADERVPIEAVRFGPIPFLDRSNDTMHQPFPQKLYN